MKKPYNLTAGFTQRLRQLGLTALLAGGATVAAHAQLGQTIAASVNTTGTFTDLGTAGSVITTTSTDDANSTAQAIGFTFGFNGGSFTQFVLNTNGLIRLGSDAPSAANMFIQNEIATTNPVGVDPVTSTNAADVNLIMPFSFDLEAGSSAAEYRVSTTGTAPNRVCTIQWKNVHDKAATNASQYATMTFQVKLYETSNLIEFVYAAPTVATTGTEIGRYATIGIKGSGTAAGQLILASKGSSATPWSGATFIAATSPRTFFRRTVGFDAGRTFRFRSPVANDAGVAAIYTLGKIATPLALPHTVRAVIQNTGTTALTNIPVTLNVTGANTFTSTQTVASLAVGAYAAVTFAAYPATLTVGTNNVAVTIPSDGDVTNNQSTYSQQVNTSQLSVLDPALTPDGALSGDPTAAGYTLAVKYTLPAASTLNDATIAFANTGATTSYQVVVYDATGTGGAPGTALYTSAAQARAATGGTATIVLPGVAVPAVFYVGVKEASAGGAGISTQAEVPLRASTFYFSADGAVWNDVAATTLQRRLGIDVGLAPAPACAAPTAVTVGSITATGATVTFTPPVSGTSGYQVVYGPTGFNPATGGTTVTSSTSPVTLTGLTAGTTYQVYVRSNCTAGGTSASTTAVSFSTACGTTAPITVFPYTEGFDTVLAGQTVPCGITVLDANADGTTWRSFAENPFSGTNAMRYQGSFLNNVVANDWFFTPALVLPGTANTRYQVAFRYRAAGTGSTGTSNFTESLEVKSGTAATVAGQTNLLYTNSSINNLAYALANGSSTPVVAYLPAGASTQYVGFHVISAINQGNLYIDDLSVTAVTVTGTSEALLRAVNVFPNPSTSGVFNLAINGANAKQALEVEVTNNLGQRVYVGSARDNFTSQIDLSRLATGLYHLKVKNGDEYMLRQISIVK